MDEPLSKENTTNSLWKAYKKTIDFKNGLKFAIPEHNKLVEKHEREGLELVYIYIRNSVKTDLNKRNIGDWTSEWKEMHNLLFSRILIKRGKIREKELRIGDPYDDTLKLPQSIRVISLLNELAYRIQQIVSERPKNKEDAYKLLAEVHFKFVMIHPFDDGNGRIARAITDQIALYFGYPMAMVGYPKHNSKKREAYHHAIYMCAKHNNLDPLAQWIGAFIEKMLNQLA